MYAALARLLRNGSDLSAVAGLGRSPGRDAESSRSDLDNDPGADLRPGHLSFLESRRFDPCPSRRTMRALVSLARRQQPSLFRLLNHLPARLVKRDHRIRRLAGGRDDANLPSRVFRQSRKIQEFVSGPMFPQDTVGDQAVEVNRRGGQLDECEQTLIVPVTGISLSLWGMDSDCSSVRSGATLNLPGPRGIGPLGRSGWVAHWPNGLRAWGRIPAAGTLWRPGRRGNRRRAPAPSHGRRSPRRRRRRGTRRRPGAQPSSAPSDRDRQRY